MKPMKIVALLAALALVAVACGGDDEAALPVNPDSGTDQPPAAGACLEGEPDCQDTLEPLPGEEPIDLDPSTGQPIVGGGLSVAEVLASDIDGGFAIAAFYFETSEGLLLCDAIAESFPPQCGGERIEVDNGAGVEIGPLQTEGEVTWSPEPVSIIGEVVDGVFVTTPMSS